MHTHTFNMCSCVYLCIWRTKASFRRKWKACEHSIVSSAENFQLLHPWWWFLGLWQCGMGVAVAVGLPGSHSLCFLHVLPGSVACPFLRDQLLVDLVVCFGHTFGLYAHLFFSQWDWTKRKREFFQHLLITSFHSPSFPFLLMQVFSHFLSLRKL